MEIRDYETGRSLSDINIVLTAEEVAELQSYLARLMANPEIRHVELSEVSGLVFGKELSISLDGESIQSA